MKTVKGSIYIAKRSVMQPETELNMVFYFDKRDINNVLSLIKETRTILGGPKVKISFESPDEVMTEEKFKDFMKEFKSVIGKNRETAFKPRLTDYEWQKICKHHINQLHFGDLYCYKCHLVRKVKKIIFKNGESKEYK